MKILDYVLTELGIEAKEKLKTTLWIVSSSFELLYLLLKSLSLVSSVVVKDIFIFQKQMQNIEKLNLWPYLIFNFDPDKLEWLKHFKGKNKKQAIFQFVLLSGYYQLYPTALISTWSLHWWWNTFLYNLGMFVYLPVWEYLDCTEFPLREKGENNFLQSMTASSLSTITTCLMGCNSILLSYNFGSLNVFEGV